MTSHVQIDRTFDAPREEVWSAWIDPEQLAQWWGPDGFHTPVESVDIDLRPGGHLHLSCPPGQRMQTGSPAQPELGLNTDTTTRIEFSDEDGKTRMKLTDGPYEGDFAQMTTMGWNQQFEKLVGLLSRGAVGKAGDGR